MSLPAPKRVPPVICRLSEPSASDLAAIEAESNTPPWSIRLFRDEFHASYAAVFGARVRGRLEGFLVCHTLFDEGHIVNFGVRRAARGQGIGRALISVVLRGLYEESVPRATLEVRRGNLVARALYESLEFREVGVRPRYYSDNAEDALIMTLSIVDFIEKYGREDG